MSHTSSQALKHCAGSQSWHYFIFETIHLLTLTYLKLYLLEVQHTDLWEFVDDIEPVVLLVCHWIPQQAGKSVMHMYDQKSVAQEAVQRHSHILLLMDHTWEESMSSLWPVGPSHPTHEDSNRKESKDITITKFLRVHYHLWSHKAATV